MPRTGRSSCWRRLTRKSRRQPPAAKERKTREGTKQALLIEMLKRPKGATIDEIVTATGWQSHTVRGAMAGALKKKLGLTIASEKVETRGRVYRIRTVVLSRLPVCAVVWPCSWHQFPQNSVLTGWSSGKCVLEKLMPGG